MTILETPGFTQTELNEFVDYVHEFYGPEGIYPIGMTRDDVIRCLNVLTSDDGEEYEEFSGDSMDREIIREMFETV